MATQYSDQTSQSIGANPAGSNPARDNGGRVRALVFSIQTSATVGVQNDTCILGDLPRGARVLFGLYRTGAMGAGATVSIGNSTSATKYVNAVACASATEALTASTAQPIAASLATNFLSAVTAYNGTTASVTEGSAIAGQLGAVERVLLTFGGATWAATKTMSGFILYVVD
jgi:hypothetical protein